MATWFFHEETVNSNDAAHATLVRYYFDDISAEALTRSFRLVRSNGKTAFIENDRIPFADLRPDLKTIVLRFLTDREGADLRLAS